MEASSFNQNMVPQENSYNDNEIGAVHTVYPKQKPKREYNLTDKIFAVIAFVIGFAMTKTILQVDIDFGFMTAVVFLGITLFNFIYSKKSDLKITKELKIGYGITFVLSVLFVITDNSWVKVINLWLVIISNLYLVYSGYKSNNDSIIFNVFKATVISPFSEYGSAVGALFSKSRVDEDFEKSDGVKKNIKPIILGLTLSIPVTLVVGALLMSGDDNFSLIYGEVFNRAIGWFLDNFFVDLFVFTFSIPVGLYIFSAVYSRIYRKKNEGQLETFPKINTRIFLSSTCNAFLTPMSVLYVLYIFTQISYLFKTISTISSGFDYSEYARSGFFQLCAVAIVNLAVASCVIFFVKHDNKKLPKSVRGFIVAFSILTLCLIVTAMVKMVMYINIYGMTPLRVYTSIFMIYMFVLFAILIAKQIRFNMSFTKIAYALAVFVIFAMSVVPVDGLIAKYNVEMYQAGKLDWMGSNAMSQLDSSATSYFAGCDPELGVTKYYQDTLEDYNKPYQVQPIKDYFSDYEVFSTDFDIYNFNFSKYFAYLKAKGYGWVE